MKHDAGINPMHDDFFDPMSSEAPAILRVSKQEGPDIAVSLHSYAHAPGILRPAYVPLEVQEDVRSIALEFYRLLDRRDLPHLEPFEVQAEKGDRPAPFNLTSAMYHISGAASFTFECPHGIVYEGWCQVTMEQILDIQLTFYEALLGYAVRQKTAGGKPATE